MSHLKMDGDNKLLIQVNDQCIIVEKLDSNVDSLTSHQAETNEHSYSEKKNISKICFSEKDLSQFKSWAILNRSGRATVKCKFCPKVILKADTLSLSQHEKSQDHCISLLKWKRQRCRTCYSELNAKTSVSVCKRDARCGCNFSTIILTLAEIEVDSKDYLCTKCCEKLVSMHLFRVQVRTINKHFVKTATSKKIVRFQDKVKSPAPKEQQTIQDVDHLNPVSPKEETSRQDTEPVAKVPAEKQSESNDDGVDIMDIEYLEDKYESTEERRDEEMEVHKCAACGNEFTDTLSLLHHVRTTHLDYSQAQAKKRGSSGVKGVPESEPHRCGVCSEVFTAAEDLDEHCRRHGDTEVIMCALCDRIYLKFLHFKRHFKVHHPECESIICTSDTESLLDIIDADASAELLSVSRISTVADIISAFVAPTEDAVEIEAYVQVCGLCGEVMLSPELLTEHNNTQHPDFHMRCYFCAKSFMSRYKRDAHILRCRHLHSALHCLACPTRCASPAKLTSHYTSCHTARERQLWDRLSRGTHCEHCGGAFKSWNVLKTHKYFCGPLEECECDVCHRKFDRKGKLKRHMRTHMTASKRLCQYCGRSFNSSDHLKAHIRSRHTGEKPYQCDLCFQRFTFRTPLTHHLLKHSGTCKFECEFCQRKFYRKELLTRHRMTHTGERPYRCELCDAGFIQKTSLNAHLKKHYTLPDEVLALDPEPFKSPDESALDEEEQSARKRRGKKAKSLPLLL